MKIVITTLIWKRPEIFKIWATSVCRIINSFPKVDFKVLVAGSEGYISQSLVNFYGFDYIETPNEPLGTKANLRLQQCMFYDADYILFLGSDDVMNNATFKFILNKMHKGFEEIAPMDLYIYDTVSKQLIYSKGYTNQRRGERLAIGRAISTDILKRMGWNMWRGSLNRSLDGSARKSLDRLVTKPFYFHLHKNGLMILDIKTKENLSPFKVRDNHTIMDCNLLKLIEEHELIKSV